MPCTAMLMMGLPPHATCWPHATFQEAGSSLWPVREVCMERAWREQKHARPQCNHSPTHALTRLGVVVYPGAKDKLERMKIVMAALETQPKVCECSCHCYLLLTVKLLVPLAALGWCYNAAICGVQRLVSRAVLPHWEL